MKQEQEEDILDRSFLIVQSGKTFACLFNQQTLISFLLFLLYKVIRQYFSDKMSLPNLYSFSDEHIWSSKC